MSVDSSVFSKQLHLGTSDCDVNGAWKIASMLDAVQNTANEHCEALHIWYHDLFAKNLSWVLFKTEVQIDRYPQLGEKVTIHTFTKGIKSFFCPRYYVIMDETGNAIVSGGSLLALIDRTTRKAVSPKDMGIEIPDAQDAEIPIKISMRRKYLEGESRRAEFLTQYSDIDINGHVNNARYADWLCNSLGMDMMRKNEVEYFSVDYSHEVIPDQVVESILTLNENEFQFIGSVGAKRSFTFFGRIRPRM